MPCQCGTTAALEADPEAGAVGCECGSGADTEAGCACGSGAPDPSGQERSLESVVMELDKRLRKLEASR